MKNILTHAIRFIWTYLSPVTSYIFINEKSWLPEGGWSYTHDGVRPAYLSVVHCHDYLFTCHTDCRIPNTTNTCDGHFSHVKDIVRIHRGLHKELKQKVLDTIFLESTITPKKKKKWDKKNTDKKPAFWVLSHKFILIGERNSACSTAAILNGAGFALLVNAICCIPARTIFCSHCRTFHCTSYAHKWGVGRAMINGNWCDLTCWVGFKSHSLVN